MLNNKFLMSKRRQANLLAHFGFTKKLKTNDSVEQQQASSSADDAFLRATDTTAAPAGKPAACESPPTPGPEIQRLEAGLHLPFSPGYGISEVVLRMLMQTWFLVAMASGKNKGGGLILYVDNRWRHTGHITVKENICCQDVELLAVRLRSHYAPREFSHIVDIIVYIPP